MSATENQNRLSQLSDDQLVNLVQRELLDVGQHHIEVAHAILRVHPPLQGMIFVAGWCFAFALAGFVNPLWAQLAGILPGVPLMIYVRKLQRRADHLRTNRPGKAAFDALIAEQARRLRARVKVH